jgi:hypothetical protein
MSPGFAPISMPGSVRESQQEITRVLGFCPCRSLSNRLSSLAKYFFWKPANPFTNVLISDKVVRLLTLKSALL